MVRTALVIGVLAGMMGCGDNGAAPEPSCYVPSTSVISYGDCNVTLSDGTACVTFCGQLPDDGTLGTLLPVGCQVQIGTSTPRTGTCVASCSDCP